jgi:PII-like signaling protein
MTHKLEGERSLMRIFLGELDRCQAGPHSGRPLHEAILLTLGDEGCSGATVVRAIAGFGGSAGFTPAACSGFRWTSLSSSKS